MRRHINGRRQILRAVTACAMVWILAVSMAIPVSAATARATTMRLEKTEGTVTLKTQNGTARTISNGMRLYNGNTLATATSGYAYISLDSTKAVKLDQNSSATLRQNGKQLELLVKRGKLFFNVSQPLTEKENMNVRTSTMVTGIRGTCGIVEYVNVNRSKLYLLEGKVTLGSGENKTTVYGGQTATVVLQPKKESDGTDKPGDGDKPGDTSQTGAKMEQKVMVDTLTEEEIPTVALQEIVSDPILQEKIEQTTDLKIEKIEEVYEEFQKEEAERNDQEQTEQDSDKPTETEPEKETEQEQTTTSGGGSYVPSTPATPAADPSTLSGTVTLEQLNTAFASYNAVTLAGTLTMNSTETVSIPAGKSLTVSGSIAGDGVISLGAGSALTNSGTIRATSISDAATNDDYHPYAGVLRLMSYRLREASATTSVTNNGRIELIGDYWSGATYQYDTQAVLILPGETSSVLTDSGIWLLTTSASTSVYASELNQRVADYLCECTQSGAATADFRQDATVTSNVTLKSATDQNDLQLVLYENKISVTSGTLTLDSSIKVNSSSADAVIALAGGNLAITGTSKSGGAHIMNEGLGYGVSISNGSKITWSNPNFMIQTRNGPDMMIQGVTTNSDNYTVTLPANVTVTGVLQCSGNSLLVLLPEFTSATVKPLLQAALNGYDTVTLGAEASVSMHDGDTLTIPSGKTLNIGCQVTENTSGGETYYSGGFNMTEKSVLAVQPGAKVNVSGWVQGNGTLTVGSGATVEVGTAGKIEASEISLDGASLTNGNIIDGGNLTSTGGSTITNNALIKLSGAYTLSSSSVDKYTTSDDGALISGSESTALASGGQFMFTMDATDGTNNTQQYYYASYLNERVQNYVQAFIDDANKNQKTYTCTFKNNVIVKNGSEITLTGFNADVGTCKLQVEGALTLTDIKAITGTGIAVICVSEAGELTLGGTGEGTISNTNSSALNYAIAVQGLSDPTAPHLYWENVNLTIESKKDWNKDMSNSYIIQGCSTDEDNKYILSAWVKCKDGCLVKAPQGSGVAELYVEQ